MILKIIQCYDCKVHDIVFDAFDQVRFSNCDFTKEVMNVSCACSIYEKENTKLHDALRIELANGDNILHRVIYVDPSIRVYLMSNEGKTIEKYN